MARPGSKKPRVFIDGEAGTTGLEISERLAGRDDLELLRIEPSLRKDEAERRQLFQAADLAVLCLPDDAARRAVSLARESRVKLLDASTAHRCELGWVYGFAELVPGQREAIRTANRVANPGCYATGFIALVRPLVARGLLPKTQALSVQGLSGYSGGGRQLIERFEAQAGSKQGLYALGFEHKHVPEMLLQSGLDHRPLFCPSVADFRQGMLITIPLELGLLPGTPSLEAIHDALSDHYQAEPLLRVRPLARAFTDEGMLAAAPLDPEALTGSDLLELSVFGNRRTGQALLVARFDNLGKGAAGAAVQNLNLMLGLPEVSGLALGQLDRASSIDSTV